MRGEYLSLDPEIAFLTELPPRARRIREHETLDYFKVGTTSACAENTHGHGAHAQALGNYLRVRGEYIGHRRSVLIPEELPPRARRIRLEPTRFNKTEGTTSACAENTLNELGLL